MHWAYEYAKKLKPTKEDDEIIVAAGTSPSGTVHIGNFRDIVTAYFIVTALKNQGVNAKLLFSWDDYDRLRKVPKNISEEKRDFYEKQIGKPYTKIPSPFNDKVSYAEHFKIEYEDASKKVGMVPDIIRYQTEEYEKGRYAEQTIIALQNRKRIFDILDEHRTQSATVEEKEHYYPLGIYCECCNKDNTKIKSFDNNSKIDYHCNECGFDGTVDIKRQSNYKLQWKVDWPMRWKEENIQLEPGGTDHAAEHGSYTVAKQVSREIYNYEAPELVPYAFIGIKGVVTKMSGSSGLNISLNELLKVYPKEIILWMYAKRQLNDEFMVDLGKDVPKVYKEFDRFRHEYYSNPEEASEIDREIMSLILDGETKDIDVIPFDKLVTVYGVSNKNLKLMASMLRKLGLNVNNLPELKERLKKVIYWAEKYSPESIIHVNTEPNVDYYENMNSYQKNNIFKFINSINDDMSETEIMQKIYQIPKNYPDETITLELKAKQRELFKDLYNLIISSDRGPALSTLVKATGVDKIKELIIPLIEQPNTGSNPLPIEGEER